MNSTAELPRVQSWWVFVILGIAGGLGLSTYFFVDDINSIPELGPLLRQLGPFSPWAGLAGVVALLGMLLLLLGDWLALAPWMRQVRRFQPPHVEEGSWIQTVDQYCRQRAGSGGRAKPDEIAKQVEERRTKYLRDINQSSMFKYYLFVTAFPVVGLGLAIFNLNVVGPAFPLADVIWPVAGGTLSAGVILILALLFALSVKRSVQLWNDKMYALIGAGAPALGRIAVDVSTTDTEHEEPSNHSAGTDDDAVDEDQATDRDFDDDFDDQKHTETGDNHDDDDDYARSDRDTEVKREPEREERRSSPNSKADIESLFE